VARVLHAGRRVLDACLGRRRHPRDRPAAGDLTDLVPEPGRAGGPSIPEPRTGHNITNVEILEQSGNECKIRYNWFTLYYRYQALDTYFGTSFYTLDTSGPQPLIKYKKVILKNDYIHHVVDIYHV
jgi:3-phenylpropionate/cinnamic acid dioxygenase small subunit